MTRFRNRMLVAAVAAMLFTASTGIPTLAIAGELSPQVSAVRDRWAEVNYNTPKKQREAAFDALAKQAAAARAAQPKDANALIWEGIVLSSFAGERGGLGALGLAKQARADFEQAIKLDPTALDGSAYTSLGVLYYSVPGWPVGFGDDKKARELLRKGLQVNPNGIDPNYFQGDFLQDQGDWKGAAAALDKALAAPARPGREVADQGRRKEATALLAKVRAKLAGG
jgi:tetratricopeptide (TPR) repeat protein